MNDTEIMLIDDEFYIIIFRHISFYILFFVISIENRIYIEELKESLGVNFFSPFQPEREFKV